MFAETLPGEAKLVGVQCKSCGHRALYTPKPSEPFMMDHEIVTKLSQSQFSAKCSQCGGIGFNIHSMSSNLVDHWLAAGPLSRSPAPLIEGGDKK